MAKLTLFWGNKKNASFTWHFCSEQKKSNSIDGELSQSYQLENHEILKADLVCIADMAKGHEVDLVVSSIDVGSAQVLVPNKAQKVLRKAVPYMLEDELATSVDNLFFAFTDKTKDNLLNVRAIEKEYLEFIIESFKAAEIKLTSVSVDIDHIKVPQEGLKLVIQESEVLVIDSSNNRWQCHQDDFTWLIQKQLDSKKDKSKTNKNEENKDEDDSDLSIAIPLKIISSEATDEFEHQLPVGRFAVDSENVADHYEYILNQSASEINLLQAEYEVQKENSQLNQFLIKVATVAGFVLLTHLIYQGVNIVALSEQVTQLEKQKTTLYKQAFPNSKNVRNPEKSMKIYFKNIGSSSGDSDFLSLLNSSSEKLTDLSQVYPTNISYDKSKSELRLDVIASDLIVLDQYAEALKASGHQVERSSETQRGEGYSSRLVIIK
jgi:general secretion pathway protein L